MNQINGGLIKQAGTVNVGSTTTITKNEAGRILLTSNKIELSSESQTLAEGDNKVVRFNLQPMRLMSRERIRVCECDRQW
jgi:hypothetical protein